MIPTLVLRSPFLPLPQAMTFLRESSGERGTSHGTFCLIWDAEYKAISIDTLSSSSVTRWVTEYPLATAHRMMQLVYPEATQGYDLTELSNGDSNIMRCIAWAPADTMITDADDLRKPSVVICVQAPWILSPQDMRAFLRCSTVRVSSFAPVRRR